MLDDEGLATQLLHLLESKGLTLVTAESCTAGMLAQRLADAPGAAQRFHGSYVTYTKEQKSLALGVPTGLLQDKGAVCAEVARAMAQGALQRSRADLAAAITGVAGPEPDEDGNPVGRICIAVTRRGGRTENLDRHYSDKGPDEIRRRAIADTLRGLIAAVNEAPVAAAKSKKSA
jgi:nicotinamide-nucleotide amidase